MAELGERLGALCSTVVREAEATAEGILERDWQDSELASTSRPVGRLARDAERACQRVLAIRHPVGDLRFLTTTLKIVVDLQRMGETCARIGKALARLPASRVLPASLSQLAGLCLGQVQASIGAFLAIDPVQAGKVIADRELVAASHQRAVTDLLSLMIEDEIHRPFAEGLLSIAKLLDSLGDHAANASELVISIR
jgi:phosphate transport system protein